MNKFVMTTAAACLALGSAAHAATLNIVGGNDFDLESDFSLFAETGLTLGTTIKSFDSSNIAEAGLFVSGPTTIRYTFIGKEASATNLAFGASSGGNVNTPSDGSSSSNVTEIFNNQNSIAGTSVVLSNTTDFVNFLFETAGLSGAPNNVDVGDGIVSGAGTDGYAIIRNALGADDDRISLGLYQNADGSVFAMFGDGRGDNDYDDMVLRIAAVPLPAGGLLLLTGFGALALRRRKQVAKSA